MSPISSIPEPTSQLHHHPFVKNNNMSWFKKNFLIYWNIFVQIINIILAWRTVYPILVNSVKFSIPILKEVLSFGTSTLLMTASAKLYRQGITIGVGIFVGTYSSIFLASPFLVMWQSKSERKIENSNIRTLETKSKDIDDFDIISKNKKRKKQSKKRRW